MHFTLMFNSVCCPLVVIFLNKVKAQRRLKKYCVDSLNTCPPWTLHLPSRPLCCCVLYFSELLQTLDMCENDPVAVARCFVDKVRGKVLLVLSQGDVSSPRN